MPYFKRRVVVTLGEVFWTHFLAFCAGGFVMIFLWSL